MVSPFFVARLKICVLRGHTVKEFAKGRDLRMEPLIQMTNIFKTYGAGDVQVAALKQLNLSIFPGEFAAITGHSGSGKSTLMNLLGCLDFPSQGEYLLNGESVTDLSDRQLSHIRNRQIGFIFQGFNLLPKLSALENVELPLIYQGVGVSQRRAAAREALERVGLGQRMKHRPAQLSGGQQQRCAIARAIAVKPSLILADEPTGNLDKKTGREILQIFRELHQAGNTIVLITSNLGARFLAGQSAPLGFAAGSEAVFEKQAAQAVEEAKKWFRPELVGRLDELIVFRPLSDESMSAIAEKMLCRLEVRAARSGYQLRHTPQVGAVLAARARSAYGARELRRQVDRAVEQALADQIAAGTACTGQHWTADCTAEGTIVLRQDETATL